MSMPIIKTFLANPIAVSPLGSGSSQIWLDSYIEGLTSKHPHTLLTLVDIFGAVEPLIPGCARASVGAVDGAGVADRVRVARVRCAGVIEVAEETWNDGQVIMFCEQVICSWRNGLKLLFRSFVKIKYLVGNLEK